jgi:hypothetical protein
MHSPKIMRLPTKNRYLCSITSLIQLLSKSKILYLQPRSLIQLPSKNSSTKTTTIQNTSTTLKDLILWDSTTKKITVVTLILPVYSTQFTAMYQTLYLVDKSRVLLPCLLLCFSLCFWARMDHRLPFWKRSPFTQIQRRTCIEKIHNWIGKVFY